MSCRGACNPFLRDLCQDQLSHAILSRERKLHAPCRFGSWLSGADLFDCAAFGMSSAEATVVDPQQRLVLEVVATVLPSGRSMTADTTEWQPCGVFTGISSMDYARLTDRHGMTGTAFNATGDLQLRSLMCTERSVNQNVRLWPAGAHLL